MEGLSITTLVIVGVILFMFKNMIAKSAEMGEKEFVTMTRAQEILTFVVEDVKKK